MKHLSLTPLALMLASVLAGCSVAKIAPMQEQVQKDEQKNSDMMAAMNAGHQKIEAAELRSSVTTSKGSFLPVKKASRTVEQTRGNDPALSRPIAVNRVFASVQDLAERVTGLTGIPVTVAPDVVLQNLAVPGAANPAAGGAALPGAQGIGGLPLPTPIGGVNLNATTTPGGFPAAISYTGNLAGLLDVAVARAGVSWEFMDGQIRLFRYSSRTFRINALPGETTMDASVGTTGSTGGSSGGSGGGSGGSGGSSSNGLTGTSTQGSGMKFSGLSVWKGLEESIKAMLTKDGKVQVSPSLGTVTVTDTPASVAAVERFIDDQNAALARQVVVNVKVLRVDLSDKNSYGINWDAVYTSLSNGWGFGLSSGTSPITGAGAISTSILNSASGPKTKPWAGTSALIEALSTQGRVSSVTSATVTTINNQPAPIQVGKQTSYIASSNTTISSGVASTAITSGTISSGFSMTVLPHIMANGRMFLQYKMDLSTLVSLEKVTSGTSMIQTPDLDTRNSLQRVIVNSGDTIVVSGFENNELSADTAGVLDANNPALGGSILGSKKRNVLVMLIQPVMVDQ